MASVGEVLAKGRASLQEDSEYPARDAVLLLALALDKPSEYPYLHPEDEVPEAGEKRYRRLVGRRRSGEPVAYLRGYQEFMGMRFRVDPRVLIPRPETEILVEAALAELDEPSGLARLSDDGAHGAAAPRLVADICCGSGAIGLSIARLLPGCRVVLADISEDALEVCRENAASLRVLDRVDFLQGDLLSPLLAAGYTDACDIVVSNPPYIPRDEMGCLLRDVRCFEPSVALDGGPGGLAVVERLAVEATAALRPGGRIFVEIGAGQGAACSRLFGGMPAWQDCRMIPDYAGIDRVFSARKGGRRGGCGDQDSSS